MRSGGFGHALRAKTACPLTGTAPRPGRMSATDRKADAGWRAKSGGRSAKATAGFGEGVFVGGDRFVHGIVGCEVLVFAFELPVEPAGQVA